MIADAVDTLITLGWALAAWIALTSVAVGLALYAVPVGAARRAVAGALAASRALRALRSQPERYRPPQQPAWAAA